MDELLEQEIISDVEWISQEIPNSSLKELAVGYMVGMLRSAGITVGATSTVGTYDEYDKMVWSMVKRKLPQIIKRVSEGLSR